MLSSGLSALNNKFLNNECGQPPLIGTCPPCLQRHQPASHTIIEAHPDVFKHAEALGWGNKPGVRLLFGRWQDVLPTLEGQKWDGIFFDT
jgi:protein arginine N-methyltransferase 2